MKLWFYGFAMCQSMFCAIPCPWHVWDEKARDKMLQCLPLLGMELGLIWWALAWFCRFFALSGWISGLLLCGYPFLSTGYIHLDGFMDVTDAVKSYRSLQRRREILKDSHVGSFAVIGCILLILAQFAFCASFSGSTDIRVLLLIPVASRCCSVLAVNILPKMSTSQYSAQKREVSNTIFPVMVLSLCVCTGFCFGIRQGFVMFGECAGYGIALRRAYRSLEGMNGDVSGYAQTLSEVTALAFLALL